MYKILSDRSAEKLADKVNLLKKHVDRWSELGGLAIHGDGKEIKFYQAMVRKETTPLMEDLQSRVCADHAKVMIGAGADVNACDKQKITPLMFAGAFSTEEIVNLLISKKADVNAKDEEDNTPLAWAVMHSNRLENINALINAGADVNAVCSGNYTILMLALINNDNVGIIKCIIDKGADVNAKCDSYNVKGVTPLMLALKHDHSYATIKRLLDAGADVNAEDSHGKNSWNYAKDTCASDKIIELLKEYGAIQKEN